MFFEYQPCLADEVAYDASVLYSREAASAKQPQTYSFKFWVTHLSDLMSETVIDSAVEAGSDKAVKAADTADMFAAVYATADSWSYGEEHFELDDNDEPEEGYFDDHSRFMVRAQAFMKKNAVDIVASERPFRPGRLTAYLENGCKSAAPKTEDEFVKWAGTGPMMEESLRKAFRVTSDLREAYRNLIKACLPFIDSPENKAKAKQLYKDFYHFTALEWEITLPM